MSPTLIPDPTHLRLGCLTASQMAITMVVPTTSATAPCTRCQQPSGRRHSRYQRTLADLSWNGIAVQIRLQARRFFCDNDACQRRIFTERVPAVAAPYARRTTRLAEWLTHVAFALGGLPGARLLRHGGCAVSRQTLLRLIHAFPGATGPTPRVLSADDFAFRKGRTYGTILVDLERHQVIDLLPEREATREPTAEAMRERWTQIHALAGEGLSKEAIAERLGLNRKTVYRYLALTAPPPRRHGWRQESALAP